MKSKHRRVDAGLVGSFQFAAHLAGAVEFGRRLTSTVRVFLAMASAAMIVSCSRAPSFPARIQSAGGEAALKRDCQSLIDEQQKTQKAFWVPKESKLQPTIAALLPQVVQATLCDSLPMVDIQVSGGFSHRGLIVMLTNTPPDFVPRKGRWRVTRIGDGVFEYRE